MERKKASDFPQELLNLLDGYVHGRTSRREFLDGAQKFAVGALTASALFEMLRPNYAWAVQVPADDRRIRTSYESVQSPQGNGSITLSVARTAGLEFLPIVWERFDLVFRQREYFRPGQQSLLKFMHSSAFRERAREFGGYDVEIAGDVRS